MERRNDWRDRPCNALWSSKSLIPEAFRFTFVVVWKDRAFIPQDAQSFAIVHNYLRYLHALLRHVSPRRRMHEQSVKAAAGSDSFAGEWREARHVVARRPRKRRSRQ